MANARRTRRRKEGRPRPSAHFPAPPSPADVARRLLGLLLVPTARIVVLWHRLQARLFALGLRRVRRTGVVTVGVGGMSPECRGRVLLSAWLLGWANARGVAAAVAGHLGGGEPPVRPFQVLSGSDPDDAGPEAALIARYAPPGRIIIDEDQARAARTAVRTFGPDLLLLQDALGDPRLGRDLDLALLTPEDLGQGWDRVFPAGRWRREAAVLSRAAAFCVFAGPAALHGAMAAAEKRLAPFGRPVFGMTFSIWRWRGPDGPAERDALFGMPYIAVLGESDRELLPQQLHDLLGGAPRLALYVHDGHRFTHQDLEFLRADALRLRVGAIVTSPRIALKLRSGTELLHGLTIWTYDPEVAFGPGLFTDLPFLSWWEQAFRAAAEARQKQKPKK